MHEVLLIYIPTCNALRTPKTRLNIFLIFRICSCSLKLEYCMCVGPFMKMRPWTFCVGVSLSWNLQTLNCLYNVHQCVFLAEAFWTVCSFDLAYYYSTSEILLRRSGLRWIVLHCFFLVSYPNLLVHIHVSYPMGLLHQCCTWHLLGLILNKCLCLLLWVCQRLKVNYLEMLLHFLKLLKQHCNLVNLQLFPPPFGLGFWISSHYMLLLFASG